MSQENKYKPIEEHELDLSDLDKPQPEGISKKIKGIATLIVALMLILMIVPYYSIKIDPHPKEISVDLPKIENISPPLSTIEEVVLLETTQPIRNLALQIVTKACPHNQLCYARALFYFVRDDIIYVSDPPYEYIQHPEETLIGGGDCEDQTILLYMLMRSIGIESRIALIPGHAYLQIYLPDAPRRYRDSDGWTSLDPTCEYCTFGEVPPGNKDKRTTYIPRGLYP